MEGIVAFSSYTLYLLERFHSVCLTIKLSLNLSKTQSRIILAYVMFIMCIDVLLAPGGIEIELKL